MENYKHEDEVGRLTKEQKDENILKSFERNANFYPKDLRYMAQEIAIRAREAEDRYSPNAIVHIYQNEQSNGDIELKIILKKI